jgi:hypothetical protein
MRPTTLTGCLIAASLLAPLHAPAQVTTNRSASIIIFPRVIADGTADTVIQITNEADSTAHAHCFYVNGAPVVPGRPPGPVNPSLWASIDFDIVLTTLQPTHWVASRGRAVDSTDANCSLDELPNCGGAGLDPGQVPALPPDFRGELLCIEVDATGAPINGDHLIGVATLQQLSGGDVAKYNAIGVRGHGGTANSGDGVLCLGGNVSAECPTGAEYDACPDKWILSHLADGAPDPLSNSNATVSTSITVVPCSHDLENQVPQSVALQFVIINEFEQTFSAATTVTCWADTPLGAVNPVFNFDVLGTAFTQTQIRGKAGQPGGFLVVAQTNRAESGGALLVTSSMANLHVEGAQTAGDVIRIPAEAPQGGAR